MASCYKKHEQARAFASAACEPANRQLNMLKKLTEEQKRAMYDEMIAGTKAYLGDYK